MSSTMRRPTPPSRRGSGGSNRGCSAPESVTDRQTAVWSSTDAAHDHVAQAVAEGVGDQLADDEQGVVGLPSGDTITEERSQPLAGSPHRAHLADEHEHVVIGALVAPDRSTATRPRCHGSAGSVTPSTSISPAMRRTRFTASDSATSRTRPL